MQNNILLIFAVTKEQVHLYQVRYLNFPGFHILLRLPIQHGVWKMLWGEETEVIWSWAIPFVVWSSRIAGAELNSWKLQKAWQHWPQSCPSWVAGKATVLVDWGANAKAGTTWSPFQLVTQPAWTLWRFLQWPLVCVLGYDTISGSNNTSFSAYLLLSIKKFWLALFFFYIEERTLDWYGPCTLLNSVVCW